MRDPRKNSEDLMRDLVNCGTCNISSSTVRRRLIEKGRMARRPIKKQLLTKAMKAKRLDWAKRHKDWTINDWRKVLFSDESHFYVQGYNPSVVRRSSNETAKEVHFVQKVKYPEKQMFWGCFSNNGPGALVPIDGMMNAVKYLPIMERRVTRELEKLGEGVVFQQDSASCHQAKIFQQQQQQQQWNRGFGLAWKLTGHEPNRKFMGYLQKRPDEIQLYHETEGN